MSTQADTIRNEIRELIIEVAEIKGLEDNVEFKDSGIDSMMGVEIVSAIERKYNVQFSDDELGRVNTLNSALEIVLSKLPA